MLKKKRNVEPLALSLLLGNVARGCQIEETKCSKVTGLSLFLYHKSTSRLGADCVRQGNISFISLRRCACRSEDLSCIDLSRPIDYNELINLARYQRQQRRILRRILVPHHCLRDEKKILVRSPRTLGREYMARASLPLASPLSKLISSLSQTFSFLLVGWWIESDEAAGKVQNGLAIAASLSLVIYKFDQPISLVLFI